MSIQNCVSTELWQYGLTSVHGCQYRVVLKQNYVNRDLYQYRDKPMQIYVNTDLC